MTLQQAIEFLEEYNAWRRGADTVQLPPSLIGVAIETVINYHKAKLN